MRRYLEARAHHNAVVDTLILTHPHDDHYPGAEGIARHFEIRNYYDPGFPKGGSEYPAFLNEVRNASVNGHPIKVMLGKQTFEPFSWGQEVRAEILYAYPGIPDGLGSDSTLENNASIVFRLGYGNHSFLFMGDGEGKDRDDLPDTAQFIEKFLLDTVPQKLKATVLKIAHHGSETSSTLPFIQAVDPEIAVSVPEGESSRTGSCLMLPQLSVTAAMIQTSESTGLTRMMSRRGALRRPTLTGTTSLSAPTG